MILDRDATLPSMGKLDHCLSADLDHGFLCAVGFQSQIIRIGYLKGISCDTAVQSRQNLLTSD